ncbi:MAG: AMP-binding protein [Clostridia bacterium]|nr:AMP-binding protein [Clostridia bacterium]
MKEQKSIAEQMKDKYWEIPTVTDLRDMILNSAKTYGNKGAFELHDKNGNLYQISYNELKDDVVSFGTGLIELGLTGKAIGLIGSNSYSWVVSYIAASIVGIVVPIDKELHISDITNFLNISESAAIIGDSKYIKQVYENKSLLSNSSILLIDIENRFPNATAFKTVKENGSKKYSSGDDSFITLPLDPNELHILLFTSGTTGKAKGVCLTHKNIVSNVMAIASIVKVDTSTKVLSILPIHHTYECTIGNMLLLFGGGMISYCDGLRYISKNINEYKPNFILCVPLLLENVHKKIFKSLEESIPKFFQKPGVKIIDSLPFFLKPIVKKKVKKSLGGNLHTFIVGAAAVNPEVVEDFFKLGFRVLQGYGLTECSPLVAGNNDFFHNYAAAGLPIPFMEYKIDEPNEEGIGQIITRGDSVMLGYYKDEEETKKVLKDGWFYTGDLGRIDSDGFLYITGRCKSVIVTKNGKNIYPEELEYYLNENPLIEEAIVVGVYNEKENDTTITASVFPNMDAVKEHLSNSNPSKEDIQKLMNFVIQDINKKFPNYKHIKVVNVRETEFEKTTTKKIKRFGDNLKVDQIK